ncbi:MAG: archaemetzincin family Zn-dependent metalloprotease [Bacteroidales bacterium]|nr:archaemetzincin family Zn-dependent metalloprotease [Bacteroidales bacterium]MCF8456042.1 archaemetzincin family Zn-dependent metalloprotease [Bacteroidales bacterium]
MEKDSILLITHGHFEKEFLDRTAILVAREFRLPITIKENHSDLSEFYDPTRRQYDGHKLLQDIDARYSSSSMIRVGLFRVDLFIPILTFIFGQAAFNGSTGVASLYRLRNEQYGIKKNEALLLERFSKVIIHEIGHAMGLIHCHIPGCVMQPSTYVEDIDQKNHEFCPNCRHKIDLF